MLWMWGDVSTRKAAAEIYGISIRRVQQLVKCYKSTGVYPVLSMKRRPRTYLSTEEKRIIVKAYNESFLGARSLRYHIQKHHNLNIPHNKIHR
jgi:transposase